MSETILAGFEFLTYSMVLGGSVGCSVEKYEVFEDDCTTLSTDFDNADNLLVTLNNGKM